MLLWFLDGLLKLGTRVEPVCVQQFAKEVVPNVERIDDRRRVDKVEALQPDLLLKQDLKPLT